MAAWRGCVIAAAQRAVLGVECKGAAEQPAEAVAACKCSGAGADGLQQDTGRHPQWQKLQDQLNWRRNSEGQVWLSALRQVGNGHALAPWQRK